MINVTIYIKYHIFVHFWTYGTPYFINLISDSDSDWVKDKLYCRRVQSQQWLISVWVWDFYCELLEILVLIHSIMSYSTYVSPILYFSDPELLLEDVIGKHKATCSLALMEEAGTQKSGQRCVDNLYTDVFNIFRITVRRVHIFEDTLVALRAGFDEKKHLRVHFLEETAVDGGGPRREFLMLLMCAIANNGSILDGPSERRVLRHAFEVHSYITFQVRHYL